ncbi:putative ABC exporter domain-containing protein [Erysipelothrix sp. P66]|uniref:putative ABC exporter domain-containing protein n=1 Tax=Erysipelothrix sp. P66 TaxID=3141531 RepID=UPI00315DE1C3
MVILLKLSILKRFAKIRNIFKKPTSALVTLGAIVLYGSMLIPMFRHEGKMIMPPELMQAYIMIVLGISAFFMLSMVLSKHQSLFFLEDSYFMFIGPFNRKQILSLLPFENVWGSMLLAILASFLCAFQFSLHFVMPFKLVLITFFMTTLLISAFSLIMEWFYLKGIINKTKSKGPRILFAGFILSALVIFGLQFYKNGFDFMGSLMAFVTQDAFFWIPLFGWAKLGLVGFVSSNLGQLTLGFGLMILFHILAVYVFANTKGDFFEQAMLDAEDFSEFYARAKAGKQEIDTDKMKHVEIKYGAGARAIHDKNVLLLKKQRRMIGLKDVLLYLIYSVMGFVMKLPLQGYVMFIIIALFNQANVDTLKDDLSQYHLYLIPDAPLRKLFNTVKLPFLKSLAITFCFTLVSGVLTQAGVVDIVVACVFVSSYVALINVSSILTIRIMKSRNNQIVDMLIRMILCLLPIGVVLTMSGLLGIDIEANILSLGITASLVAYALAGAGFVWVAPILKGTEF